MTESEFLELEAAVHQMFPFLQKGNHKDEFSISQEEIKSRIIEINDSYKIRITELRILDLPTKDLVLCVCQYRQYLLVINKNRKKEPPFVMTVKEWDQLELA